MTKVVRILVGIAIGVLLLTVGLSVVFAAPGDEAELSITPNVTTAQPGDLITVTITLEDMNVITDEFEAWNVALAYDFNMLQVANSSQDSTVWEGSCLFTIPGFDNSTPGRLDISETCVGGTSGANVPYVLGTVVFTVTNMGNSAFNVLTETNPANDTVFNGSGGVDWAPATITETQVSASPQVQFSSATYSVAEDAGPATITVTLSATSTLPVTVTYATSDGTAMAPGDYTTAGGPLVFNPGEQNATFNVPINDDPDREPDETINLTLSAPVVNATLGSPTSAILTIPANDNLAPNANDDTPPAVDEDSGANAIDVLANDNDPNPGDTITITQVTQGSDGTVIITGGGTGLTYEPDPNYFGPDTFDYTISDGILTDTATVNVTVNPVNDAPSFTAGPDQQVVENSGAQTVPGWATAISAGPANEVGQTLTFSVTNDNNALFSAQPDVDEASGDLTFTPYTDTTGSAVVTVTLSDDGGTANGGQDTSAPQTLYITVTTSSVPDISVDPLSLNVMLETGDNTTRQITITNAPAATADLNWNQAEVPPVVWLNAAPANGTAAAGESDTVNVNFTANVGVGTYTTTLRVSSNDPDQPQVDVDVTLVVTACVPVHNASIAFAPATPVVGAPTTFTGTVDDTSSTPIQFVWDFGDGSAPVSSGYQWNTSHVVAHTYALSDTYTVVMTVTNGCGQIVAVRSVVVIGEPVIGVTPLSLSAVLNPGQSAGETTPREISISNASTATADLNWGLAEVPLVTWLGEAPTSGVITPSGSSNVVVTFNSVGLAVGTYTDTLQVSSNDLDDPVVNVGVTLVVTTVCIPISGADFDFTPNRPITAGDTVVFTGSVAQGTLPLVYTWDFGDGTPEQQQFENTTTGGTTISHLYTSDKEGYAVRMTVSNCGGEVVVSKQIGKAYIYLPLVMRNFAPPEPASIDSLDSDSPVMLGGPMHFTATVSGDEPITYTWDFDDDGTPEQSGVGLDTINYTYATADVFTVTLDVENAHGGDSTSIGVTVNPAFAAPSITTVESNSPVALGEVMYFTATVAGTAPITYSWDFDSDGTPEQSGVGLATTSYIYPTSGYKLVTLEVENVWGNDVTAPPITVQVTAARARLFRPLYGAVPASEVIVAAEAFDDLHG